MQAQELDHEDAIKRWRQPGAGEDSEDSTRSLSEASNMCDKIWV